MGICWLGEVLDPFLFKTHDGNAICGSEVTAGLSPMSWECLAFPRSGFQGFQLMSGSSILSLPVSVYSARTSRQAVFLAVCPRVCLVGMSC